MTQVELAELTGLSAATVSNIVKELAAGGLVELSSTTRSGRRATQVSLARAAGVVAGVDFGERHLRVALADTSHEVLTEQRLPLASDHRGDAELDRAALLIADLLDKIGAEPHELLAVGIGLPAPIDTVSGQVGSTTLMPGWTGIAIADAFAGRTKAPVFVDNSANLGALAEHRYGAARGRSNVAYIEVSYGIGAGLLLDGRVFRGSTGTAGEIGHMTLDENGAICKCGNRGCLETYASAEVLLHSLRVSHGALSLRDMLRLAAHGDVGCRRVLSDAGRHVGTAVASLCNLFNPELVVVGGALAAAGEVLTHPMRDVVDRFAIPSAAASVEVVVGELGERAELRGAIALALAGIDTSSFLASSLDDKVS
jgi:predicted NBD/HSP70 family sugar kinase